MKMIEDSVVDVLGWVVEGAKLDNPDWQPHPTKPNQVLR
jgi:hypothetical protein